MQIKKIHRCYLKPKMIQLKAEYEIYNLLYGTPSKHEIYDNTVLLKIRKLIQKEGITFDKIKHDFNRIIK